MSSSVTATFVFTDLVDSTAIAARLGPVAAEELRQAHFRALRIAIGASGGTEVKNLGDGLMLMYSSPSRALAGAVGMQQTIEHHNRSGAHPLAIRIGMSAGEAVEEDGDYFGDPVVEAARLCAAAVGGQILAAELVRALVGRHATHPFVEAGPFELKGIPEPVAAVEVLWEPVTVAGSVPLPGRLVGATGDVLFGFFGRGPELAVLEDARKRAHSSKRCQVVFLAGEAGMGKTALVAQDARVAHNAGAIVLFGHATEGFGIAYQPWIEVVSTVARDCDPEALGALPSAQRAALAKLVPDIDAGNERVVDPDTERLLLLEGTVELLAATSRAAPVLVVLDDLHWADIASLQLLRHAIGSSTPMDVTIACTYRDTDLLRGDPLNQLLQDSHREASVTRLVLAGLADQELIELMAAAAGHELDDSGTGLAHALRRETDGSPFFAGEMLRHLWESGGIKQGDDGRWTVAGELEDLGLPNSIRDVVGRRVERLGEESLRVLRLAAVVGREFDLTTVASLAEIEEEPLLDLMDAAVVAAVVVESAIADHYRFAHALIQHTLYDELGPTRRQRAHQRVAELLEARSSSPDAAALAELAHHWVAATRPADLDKALEYVQRAGDAARDALAPEDAIRWYQQALELLDRTPAPDQHRRAVLLTALGTAQNRAGHPEYRATLEQAAALAIQVGATDTLIEAGLGIRSVHSSSIGDDAAKAVIGAALDAIGTDASPTRAILLAGYAQAHDSATEWQGRRKHSLEAVDAARRAGSDAAFVDVIVTTDPLLGTPDRVTEHDDIEQALLIADRLGDPALRARSRAAAIPRRYKVADMAGVDRAIAELEVLSIELGLPAHRWNHAIYVAARLLGQGDADGADAANGAALEIGSAAGIPEALAVFGGLLFATRLHQGRLDEIIDFFIDAARDNPSIAVLRAGVLTALCEVGRIGEARERLSQDAATGFEFPYEGSQWLGAMAHFADTAATVADHAAARTLIDILAPTDSAIICPALFAEGAIARPLARLATLLGDYEQAERWFLAAHDIHARLEAPYWTARGQLDHADLCLARRATADVEHARELVITAAATAAKYGCGGLTKRAELLLAEV